MAKRKEYSDTIQKNLKSIVDFFEKEEQTVRERQIRLWKKMHLLWNGYSRIWWSEVAHDWRVWDFQDRNDVAGDDQAYYDKPVNVFRAYLESIIAAMTSTVPGVKCVPDDPDKVSDINTAKAGTLISELIFKHNDAPLLLIQALFTYCLEGMTAAYNYTSCKNEYGYNKVEKYENEEIEGQVQICPNCKQQMSDPQQIEQAEDLQDEELDEYDPGSDDVEVGDLLSKENEQPICPNCMMQVDPELQKTKFVVKRLVGLIEEPKARQIIEVYGGLNIKIPNWARNQEDIPYLSLCYETHYVNIFQRYEELIEKKQNIDSCSGTEWYERWGRLSPQYYNEYPTSTPTVREWWLRPCSFNYIQDDKERAELFKEFPMGVHCTFINEVYAEAKPEDLDDHWTIAVNPLSKYVHYDPLGMLLTSIQEITNDIISLVVQTMEHGIGQTFADPTVLNFKQYRETEAVPGQIFPARPKSGKGLSEAFYDVSTASLSPEVQPFGDKIQQLGEFVSGAQPSLFGGEQSSSSRTAAQYAMSRAQSLQRLQTPWKMFTFWWKNIFGKVIPAYIKDMVEDEYYVKQQSDSSYTKILIEKAKLDGKIGSVELETSDQLPMTSQQVRDVVMQLMQMNNPMILQFLSSPENFPLTIDAIGIPGFKLEGEDDREKQLEEIQQLIESQPIPTGQPNMMGQPDMAPSVHAEFTVDTHEIHVSICKNWAVSEAGRLCKVDNPQGYKNVLLHMKEHLEFIQQQTAMAGNVQDNNQPQQPANAPKPPQKPVEGPVTSQETPNARPH